MATLTAHLVTGGRAFQSEFARIAAPRAAFGKIYIRWLKTTTRRVALVWTIFQNLSGLDYIERVKRTRNSLTKSLIDRAIARARKLREGPLAKAVEYRSEPALDMFILKLTDGSRRMFPREDLQGLETGTPSQLSRVEIVGGGTGLYWPELDADLYVPALLQGIYGTKLWMAKIGSRGGSATSPAKKKAARANGKLGGRPRRNAAAGD